MKLVAKHVENKALVVNTRGAGCGWARVLRNGISHPANLS